MLLEIVATTDGKFVGRQIDTSAIPVLLCKDRAFLPDRIFRIGEGRWRLANPSYVIDAVEVSDE